MLSKKAKYGVRALLHLGTRYGGGPVMIKEIADKESIPKKFLEAILLEMRDAGILHSRPGKGGGYILQRPPKTISMGRVIRLLDGPLAPIPCVSQTAYAPCSDCVEEDKCVIRGIMKQVRDATAHILDGTTLEDLIENQKRYQETPLVMDFNI